LQVEARGELTSLPAMAPFSSTCFDVAHWMNSQAAPFFWDAAFIASDQIQIFDSKFLLVGACNGGANAILPDAGLPATSFQNPNILESIAIAVRPELMPSTTWYQLSLAKDGAAHFLIMST